MKSKYRYGVHIGRALRKTTNGQWSKDTGKRDPYLRELREIIDDLLSQWTSLVNLRKRVRQHHPRVSKEFDAKLALLDRQIKTAVGILRR